MATVRIDLISNILKANGIDEVVVEKLSFFELKYIVEKHVEAAGKEILDFAFNQAGEK